MTAIFVPDVHARAMIAAVRSLGRAGYEVHAGSPDPEALGLKSAYATAAVVYPSVESPDFIPWLRQYVHQHDIKMIVPSAGVLYGVKSAFAEFKPLLPVSADERVVYDCFSKINVFKAFAAADPALKLLDHHPASVAVDLSAFDAPCDLPPSRDGYFVKAEGRIPLPPEHGAPPSLSFAATAAEVQDILRKMQPFWRTALVQAACDGIQVCVSALMDQGRPLALSCVRDRHPLPHSKGTMSLRESCWLPDIVDDTVKRLAYLKWQGCAMGEYRYNPTTGAFHLIEINFRYWQYLHLDIFAGVDFPRLQAEWFLDGKQDFSYDRKLGVIARDTWPGEVAQLANEWKRRDLNIFQKLGASAAFLGRFFDPRIHQDMSFPGDRKLLWYNFRDFVRGELRSAAATE